MFRRLDNSWNLVKASWAVLLADKELLIFPIISMVVVSLVTLTFLVPGFFWFSSQGESSQATWSNPLFLVFLLVFYLAQYTIIFFCNTALVGAAMIRLNGGDPTVSDGFHIASERMGKIVAYAFISATVGMFFRWLSEKGLLGRIVAGFIGIAWNIATYLVVPVLVVEDVGPIEAIKRSASLLKQSWGEQIVGHVGISVVFGFVTLGIIVAAVPLMIAVIALKSVVLIIGTLLALIVLLIGIGLLSSALSGIYTAAVYRYATTGNAGEFFDSNLVAQTFRTK
ncbi:MAG TPA: DUF6159 family protein [Anaerolineae bacterium]|nr:DUF6159 family protein [Anaerolineae bacterium]